jgi:hypothetical protein
VTLWLTIFTRYRSFFLSSIHVINHRNLLFLSIDVSTHTVSAEDDLKIPTTVSVDRKLMNPFLHYCCSRTSFINLRISSFLADTYYSLRFGEKETRNPFLRDRLSLPLLATAVWLNGPSWATWVVTPKWQILEQHLAFNITC